MKLHIDAGPDFHQSEIEFPVGGRVDIYAIPSHPVIERIYHPEVGPGWIRFVFRTFTAEEKLSGNGLFFMRPPQHRFTLETIQ
jgi:hypothetical protein